MSLMHVAQAGTEAATTQINVTAPGVPPEAPFVVAEYIMASAPYVMWGTLLIFNIAAMLMLRTVFDAIDLTDALREKNVSTTVQTPPVKAVDQPAANVANQDANNAGAGAGAGAGANAGAGAGANANANANAAGNGGGTSPPADTSFSRLAGMVGSLILGCFVWALGNIIIFKSFGDVREVSELVEKIGGFFLAASALFAPYAFNQLGEAFKPRPKSGP